MSDFKNRVYGAAIIRSINANYNADFSHQPRTLPDGTCYATDKSLKYLIRNYIRAHYPIENIFYFKTFDSQLKPRTLNKRYIDLFKEFPKNTAAVNEKSGEFYFFSKVDEEIIGLIGSKIPKKKIEDTFKEMEKEIEEEDKEELKKRKSLFLKLTESTVSPKKIEDVKELAKKSEEDCYFYSDSTTLKIIEKDELNDKIVNAIELKLSGGINKPKFAKNLLSCIDIRLFGATYAGETNISIHGPVQINHGVNIWKENNFVPEQIMSPFADKDGAEATTLGRQTNLQEGHYLHHLSVNPKNIDDLVKISTGSPLADTDIETLKQSLRSAATYYDSGAKAGIDNEALIWVTLAENAKSVLPTFNNLVKLDKVDGKIVLDFQDLTSVIERLGSDVSSVEIYYMQESVSVVNAPKAAKFFDISSNTEITKL